MRHSGITALLLCGLTACGDVEKETYGTVEVYDQTYTTVTRQFMQNGQLVTTGAVMFNRRPYGCNTMLEGDCERRVELLLVDDTLGTNRDGTVPFTYVITDPNESGVKPIQIKLW